MHKPPETEAAESPFKGKTGVARIIQATFNSFAGLADAWRHESAFRQEVLMALVLIPLALVLPLERVEKGLLVAVVLLVLVVELLNSSVEAAIDRISFDHHNLSKRAKDIGSAAVFVSLFLMSITWYLILMK
ncbi:diacylglycerol kinase [Betaproteobacteria bacterium GR16-43]|nr:diacylglycerol kinase [Betaproteobacteria bacterium GR16-43]